MAEKTTPTTTEAEYVHAFEGIENFRDVGATINEFLGKRWVISYKPLVGWRVG